MTCITSIKVYKRNRKWQDGLIFQQNSAQDNQDVSLVVNICDHDSQGTRFWDYLMKEWSIIQLLKARFIKLASWEEPPKVVSDRMLPSIQFLV